MLSLLAIIESHRTGLGWWLLAQSGKSLSIPWAIVILAILLGLAITLSPTRRSYEVKRPRDE